MKRQSKTENCYTGIRDSYLDRQKLNYYQNKLTFSILRVMGTVWASFLQTKFLNLDGFDSLKRVWLISKSGLPPLLLYLLPRAMFNITSSRPFSVKWCHRVSQDSRKHLRWRAFWSQPAITCSRLYRNTRTRCGNMFKVNIKDTRTKTMVSFWCLYCYLWTYFTPCSCISIVNFKQVNVSWDS